MIEKVKIHGHIGPSFVDEKGQLHKGIELINVVEQVQTILNANPQTKDINVSIISPGGYEDIGTDIYEYLVSLKKDGLTITTVQDGLVGSIATKIYMAGDRRVIDERFKFWIHNPFIEDYVRLDADAARNLADSLDNTEKNLRKFYAEYSGLALNETALDGLMKIETGLTADQCIKFKFATEKKLVPAFNSIKMSAKKDENVLDQIKALLGLKDDKKKGVKPKSAVPAGVESKSLIVNLADDAGSFYVEGEELVKDASCFLLDAEGNPTNEPVADGPYVTKEGAKVTIKGGKIETVEMPMDTEEEEEEMAATKEEIAARVKEEVEAAKVEMKKEFEALTLALKKDVKLGVQPKTGFLSNTGKKLEYKSIGERMAEKAAERKQQLKKN